MNDSLIKQLELAIAVERLEVPMEDLQCRPKHPGYDWGACSTTPQCWNHKDYEYRRKPKPLELWFVFYDDRSAMSYESSDMARNAFDREKNSIIPPTKIVHMREVTND